MSGLFPSLYEEQAQEVEDQSFGGVTATDFFGLLMVSMFTLTLLAALTLGASGSIDEPSQSMVGGRTSLDQGIESKQSFRQITIELLAIDPSDSNQTTPDLDSPVLGADEGIKTRDRVSYDTLARVGQQNYAVISHMSCWLGHDESIASRLIDFDDLSLKISVPKIAMTKTASLLQQVDDLKKRIQRIAGSPKVADRQLMRQIVSSWSNVNLTRLKETLENVLNVQPTDDELIELITSVMVVHIKTIADGKIQSRYVLLDRTENKETEQISLVRTGDE